MGSSTSKGQRPVLWALGMDGGVHPLPKATAYVLSPQPAWTRTCPLKHPSGKSQKSSGEPFSTTRAPQRSQPQPRRLRQMPCDVKPSPGRNGSLATPGFFNQRTRPHRGHLRAVHIGRYCMASEHRNVRQGWSRKLSTQRPLVASRLRTTS